MEKDKLKHFQSQGRMKRILTIEESARQYRINTKNDHYNWKREEEAFIAGAKSDSAKAFHNEDMFSKEKVIEFINDFVKEVQNEFKEVNLDYLTFAANRFNNNISHEKSI